MSKILNEFLTHEERSLESHGLFLKKIHYSLLDTENERKYFLNESQSLLILINRSIHLRLIWGSLAFHKSLSQIKQNHFIDKRNRGNLFYDLFMIYLSIYLLVMIYDLFYNYFRLIYGKVSCRLGGCTM